MPKSGHFADGFGAFKDHRTGRYFVAGVNENGWAHEPVEALSWHPTWWSAVAGADRQAEIERAERRSHMRRCRELSERMKAEAAAWTPKDKFCEIRPMRFQTDPSRQALSKAST